MQVLIQMNIINNINIIGKGKITNKEETLINRIIINSKNIIVKMIQELSKVVNLGLIKLLWIRLLKNLWNRYKKIENNKNKIFIITNNSKDNNITMIENMQILSLINNSKITTIKEKAIFKINKINKIKENNNIIVIMKNGIEKTNKNFNFINKKCKKNNNTRQENNKNMIFGDSIKKNNLSEMQSKKQII